MQEPNRAPTVLRQNIPFMVLATFAILARIIARKFRAAAYGPDDYMIGVALVKALLVLLNQFKNLWLSP